MKRTILALALVLFAGACAPKNYVVLLENPEGGSGKVLVATNEGQQVLDEPGTATAIDKTTRAPSSPWVLGVEKIQEVFARAFTARPEPFKRFTIYFVRNKVQVDPASQADFDQMLSEARKRPGADATVAGHADRTGPDARNDGISLLRAYKMRDALVTAGIPIERIELSEYGETRPAVPTADDVPELRNRRVEVTIR
ncbi:MAG: OmpA family protein [Deltaproteobacteria bacterium]|nr:OmpA family protein [Deltaproteobacteria bacterium]